MILVLQTANVTADAKNCFYPNRMEITSGDELKAAVGYNHVCGEFKKNYRNISNFIKSKVIVVDCDNGGTRLFPILREGRWKRMCRPMVSNSSLCC